MKYDYTVTLKDGREFSSLDWSEARKTAAEYKQLEPIIDQFYKDDEQTDVYWHYKDGKLVKVM